MNTESRRLAGSARGVSRAHARSIRTQKPALFVCDNFVERCGPGGGRGPRAICHICLQPRALHEEPIDTSWCRWLATEVLAELAR